MPYDHYRDCENYNEGCVVILELEDKLSSVDYIRKIEEDIENKNKTEKPGEEKTEKRENKNTIKRGQWFNNRRRWR